MKPDPDWPEIRRLYCETTTPASHICRSCGVGATALRGRARREGWERPGPVHRGPPGREKPQPGATYATAEEYLEAVVCGTEPPDPARVSAARVLMAYQQVRKRLPKPAERTPQKQAAIDATAEERAALDEWARKAEVVRERLARERKRLQQ